MSHVLVPGGGAVSFRPAPQVLATLPPVSD
jgi:hypothetical protein